MSEPLEVLDVSSVLLAQYLSSLQLANGGRTITTLACCRRWRDLQVGLSLPEEADQRMVAGFRILDLLQAGQSIPDSLNGEWDASGLRLDPAPQKPIEVWVNGTDELAFDLATRWAHFLKPSGKSPEQVRTSLRPALDAARAEYGRQVGLAISTLVFVINPADDPSWLRDHIEFLIEHERPGGVAGATHVYGPPEQYAEQITELFESGVDYVALDTHCDGWETLELGMEQLHRLVEQVLPLLDPGVRRPLPTATIATRLNQPVAGALSDARAT